MGDGFSIIQLEEYFKIVKTSFAEFANWDLKLYIKFLYDQNLIIKDNVTGRIRITPVGDIFLRYLIINGYNFNTEKGL